jgi:DNA-binding PadR family transcriptional regulator
MLLLVVCKLQDEAFGLTIREDVEALTGKRYSVGGIYVPLDRLVRKGFLTTEDGKPTEERMGRPRRLYKITADGLVALREARSAQEAMWASLPDLIAQKLRLT